MLTPFWRVENEIWTTKKTGLLRQKYTTLSSWNILADMKYFGRHSSAFICLLSISHPGSTFPSFLSFHLQFCQSYFIAYRFCIISLCHSCPPFLPQSISLLFWSRFALRWTRVMPHGKVTEWKKEREKRKRGREREGEQIWFNLFGFIIFLCTRFLIWEMPLEGEWSR